ncbi:MAG: hypothetical protein COA78_06055 [Blastopirellula sp.]|nr:MAG: hypothetical protein COA78_06055 [Blastopirellula sp.]
MLLPLRLFITGFGAYYSSDLISTWTKNDDEAIGAFLFIIWLTMLIASSNQNTLTQKENSTLFIWGFGLSVIGELISTNSLQHIGFIMLISSFFAPMNTRWSWISAGVLSLPVSGYLSMYLLEHNFILLRSLVFVLLVLNASDHIRGRILFRGWSITNFKTIYLFCCVTFLLILLSSEVNAETYTISPIQATARPFGLNIVNQVGVAGSDAESANFMVNEKIGFDTLINDNLSEREAVSIESSAELISLDPLKMTLTSTTDVRAYFLGEGAGYHNSVGFNADGLGISSGDPKLLFPDASASNSYLSSGGDSRTPSEPLMPGDFVNLGEISAGSFIDFFLIANGANGGTNIYTADSTRNPDGFDHIVAFAQVESPYVLIGFEDLYNGGDKDYNDFVMAVYFNELNVESFITNANWEGGVSASEPFSLGIIVSGCGLLMHLRRRRELQKKRTVSNPLN